MEMEAEYHYEKIVGERTGMAGKVIESGVNTCDHDG